MKILQVCDYYQPLGGTESYILNLSCDLEKLGHRIAILYAIESGHALSFANREKYFFPELIDNQKINRNRENEIRRIIDKENPDVIYLHNISHTSYIDLLARLRPSVRFIHDHRVFCPKGDKFLDRENKICRRPCGLTCFINTYVNRCLPRNPLKATQLIKQTKKQIRTNSKIPVIVASNYMKDCLIQNGFQELQIKVMPYYTSPMQYGEVFFKDFIVFAGRIHKTKGLQFLLSVLTECPAEIKLFIIGDGAYRDTLQCIVSQLGLEDRVNFLGRLSQQAMADYFINCLAVVVPSRWPEPFGSVGIEAMSYKKPVIATDVGGISDWLQDGHNGFLVKYNDIAHFAERINLLFYNRKKAKDMGEKGYQMFLGEFSKDKHMHDLLDFFNHLIK